MEGVSAVMRLPEVIAKHPVWALSIFLVVSFVPWLDAFWGLISDQALIPFLLSELGVSVLPDISAYVVLISALLSVFIFVMFLLAFRKTEGRLKKLEETAIPRNKFGRPRIREQNGILIHESNDGTITNKE